MRLKIVFVLAIGVLLTSAFATVTRADNFDWTVTTTFGLSGSGVLTATPVANTDYDLVTSFEGTFINNGRTEDLSGPYASGTNNFSGQDNLLYPDGDGGPFPGALLDLQGLGVEDSVTAGGIISACDVGQDTCTEGPYFFFFQSPFYGTFSISPAAVTTPEPGTLALLLVGFVPLGLLFWRRQKSLSSRSDDDVEVPC